VTPPREELAARIGALARRYALPSSVANTLRLLAQRLSDDPLAPTSIRGLKEIVDRHLADSLVALELDVLRSARHPLDLGSGAGLPGLALAAALPEATFVLLESAGRKCAFMERTAAACGISNVEVVHGRAESYEEGLRRHDVVTARAVAALDVMVEYAAPLLRVGGTFIGWAGKRSPEVEDWAARAADVLGLGEFSIHTVTPFDGAAHRHLYLTSKVKETPVGFPRRPGVAAKRPLGRTAPRGRSSDRCGR
jgi:16S rRNA (guanine527-N7)-methyltransferase